jgi:hypothetical protein
MIDTIASAAAQRTAETTRLLRTPLSARLLGEPVALDLLARTGFRHLRAGAAVDGDTLAPLVQRFRNTVRVNPVAARRQSIRTISDGHVDAEMALQDVSRLENARHRLRAELFWPHLSDGELGAVAAAGDIRALLGIDSVGPPANDAESILRRHAEAVVAQCVALEAELDFIERRGDPPDAPWERALGLWAGVCGAPAFSHYLRLRVRQLDDPLVQMEDVDQLREELPAVILGMHEAFAEHYAANGDDDSCRRHLRLIRRSTFDDGQVRAATAAALRRQVAVRLDDTLRGVRTAIAGVAGRVTRRHLDAVLSPLMSAADAVHHLVRSRLEGADGQLELPAFDQLADELHAALDAKIDYDNDDRERSILYGSLVRKRMLAWPVSAGCRRRLEQALRRDAGNLYGIYGLHGAAVGDPTSCFFATGEPADPDASVVVTVYRVDRREMTLDRAAGSAGVRLHFTTRRLLIPRSPAAKGQPRGGKITVQVVEHDCLPEQAAAFAAVRDLESEKEDRLAELQREADRQVQAVRDQTAARIQAAAAAAEPKLREAAQALASEGRHELELLAVESRRLEEERASIMRERKPAMQAAAANAQRVRASLRSPASFVRIEGIVLAAAALAFVLMLPAAVPIALFFAVAIAFGVGRVWRLTIERRALRLVAGLKEARDATVAEAGQRSVAQQQKIRAEVDRRRAPWQAAGRALETEKQQIEAKARQRIARVTSGAAKERADIERAFADRAEPIRSQLRRVIEAKPESAKQSFPEYRAALQKGFKEGKEPSSHELAMTEAEKRQAMHALQFGR